MFEFKSVFVENTKMTTRPTNFSSQVTQVRKKSVQSFTLEKNNVAKPKSTMRVNASANFSALTVKSPDGVPN